MRRLHAGPDASHRDEHRISGALKAQRRTSSSSDSEPSAGSSVSMLTMQRMVSLRWRR
jgi:hypothetical protein